MNHYINSPIKKNSKKDNIISCLIEGVLYIIGFATFFIFVWLMCFVANAFM